MHLYVITYKGKQIGRRPIAASTKNECIEMWEAWGIYKGEWPGEWKERPAGIECEKFKLVKE